MFSSEHPECLAHGVAAVAASIRGEEIECICKKEVSFTDILKSFQTTRPKPDVSVLKEKVKDPSVADLVKEAGDPNDNQALKEAYQAYLKVRVLAGTALIKVLNKRSSNLLDPVYLSLKQTILDQHQYCIDALRISVQQNTCVVFYENKHGFMFISRKYTNVLLVSELRTPIIEILKQFNTPNLDEVKFRTKDCVVTLKLIEDTTYSIDIK